MFLYLYAKLWRYPTRASILSVSGRERLNGVLLVNTTMIPDGVAFEQAHYLEELLLIRIKSMVNPGWQHGKLPTKQMDANPTVCVDYESYSTIVMNIANIKIARSIKEEPNLVSAAK